jgi:long-chain acyl-CoA synthetase
MTAIAVSPVQLREASRGDSLPERLVQRAREHPDRVALRHKDYGKWREYTWSGYAMRVQQAGLGLLALGVQPGDRVAVVADNRPEWLFADLGAQGIGAIVVGVYSTSPSAEVQYILEHSGSVVVVVEDEEQLDKVLDVRARCPAIRHIVLIEARGAQHHLRAGTVMTFDELCASGARGDPEAYAAALGALDVRNVAVLVYTSGTTGPPKGAMLTHANLFATSQSWQQTFGGRDTDELLSYLPLCHVLERFLSCVVALSSGYCVSFGGGGEALLSDLREVQPTLFIGVPRVWEKMLASIEIRMADASWFKRVNYGFWIGHGRRLARRRLEGLEYRTIDHLTAWLGWHLLFRPLRERLGLTRVRSVGSGAAPIAPQVLEFFWAIGVCIQEGYGQTEGSALATWNPPTRVKIGTVGVPVPGTQIRIGEGGEILVKSGGLFAGYYRNEEATRQTIDSDGWLHSGDVGELDSDGYLRITDRMKDIIITSGGKNISPSWIENKVKVSPYVREAIVIGDARKYVTALIGIELDTVGDWATRRNIPFTTYKDLSEKPEVRTLVATWVDEVNRDLAPVEQIKKFTMLPKELDHEEGELTATQKVKRRAISAMFGDLVESMYR